MRNDEEERKNGSRTQCREHTYHLWQRIGGMACVCECRCVVSCACSGKANRNDRRNNNESSQHVGISKMNLIGAANEWNRSKWKKKKWNKNATLSHRRIIVWGRTFSVPVSLCGFVSLRRLFAVLQFISVCTDGPIRLRLNTGSLLASFKLIPDSPSVCVCASECVLDCAHRHTQETCRVPTVQLNVIQL